MYKCLDEWTDADFTSASRGSLVTWLQWNDPNGEYTVDSVFPDGQPAPETDDYRAAALEQWSNGQPTAPFADVKITCPCCEATVDAYDMSALLDGRPACTWCADDDRKGRETDAD